MVAQNTVRTYGVWYFDLLKAFDYIDHQILFIGTCSELPTYISTMTITYEKGLSISCEKF